uniref:Uncharacterized protein n=1 Tax=uncultured prokaryote TaxID=198431 RepID=A0A0H5QD46_9ZZZZ|nr:hypothetical protein [uncultured prokaryote]
MSSRNPAHFPINNDTFMNELTYETALAELESIVETLEKGDLEISQLTPKLRSLLPSYCSCPQSMNGFAVRRMYCCSRYDSSSIPSPSWRRLPDTSAESATSPRRNGAKILGQDTSRRGQKPTFGSTHGSGLRGILKKLRDNPLPLA